jgi:DNA-binding transcriptional regulator YiaG
LDLRLRQIEVAKIIGCDEMSLVAWEKGYRSPRINHMAKVVKFLGFDPFPKCESLAARLLNYRKTRGLNQKTFAAWLEVDSGTLARWEREEREPKGLQAQKVEAILR